MTGHADEPRPDDPDVYTTSHDLADGEPLSTAVVMAVADAAGLDPRQLTERLYDVVDPDALDDLFGSSDGTVDGRVWFVLADYEVTVSQDGTITVRPAN